MSFPAVDPRRDPRRRAFVFSVILHAAGFFLASVFVGGGPRLGLTPVAVVDLVGGDLRQGRSGVPAAPTPKAEEREPRKIRRTSRRAPGPPATRSRAKAPPAVERPAPTPDAMPDPTAEVSEAIRKMREGKRTSDQVRDAVGAIRRESAARQAIRRIGERVARRVDAPPMRPPPGAAVPGGTVTGGTAAGTVRVSMEHLAYFRAIDERVRSNWTVPATNFEEMSKLMVQVRIKIEKDGRVPDVLMEKSSGNPYFDDSVLRAVMKSSPLPVPPESLRGGEDYYDVGFRFYGAGAMR